MAWEKEDFKPKGIYSLVYERSRTSFVDSDAHREGAEVGGQVRGQGLVLPRWWTFCSPWAFVLGHKHCFFFFFFPVEATYFYSWRCISYRLFTFCFVSSASSLLLASTVCPFPFVGVVNDKTVTGGCELYYRTSASQNTFLSKCGMRFSQTANHSKSIVKLFGACVQPSIWGSHLWII